MNLGLFGFPLQANEKYNILNERQKTTKTILRAFRFVSNAPNFSLRGKTILKI